MTAIESVAGLRTLRPPSWARDAGAVILLVVVYVVFRDRWVLAHNDGAAPFQFLNDVRDWVNDHRNSSPIFVYFFNYISIGIGDLVSAFQTVLHGMGWIGVTATAGAIGWVFSGWRIGLTALAGFLAFGVLGLWDESVDTLALTVAAVLLSLLVGFPLGVLAGRSGRVRRLLTPALDVMQIMPTFAYLTPMTLIFLIGPPAATIATMIYAIPPAIRITALGIREVPHESVEAAVSLGSTRWQTLRKVQLPMAKPAIVLAVNQTIMMALSMVVITALIDAPGLGQNIVQALEQVNVGMAFDAGMAIVIMAIALDRLTRGAGRRGDRTHGDGAAGWPARRRTLVGAAALLAIAAVFGGKAVSPDFPSGANFRFAPYVNDLVNWVELHLFSVTDAIKNVCTYALLNPLQNVLTSAPWWLVVVAVFALGLRVSGLRPASTAAGCLALVAALGLWQHGMETMATVLVATVLTLATGCVLGVWTARSRAFSAVLRPVLDAAQTMPSFVYLLPAVALFGTTRFTAIVAAVIYAFPPVVRLVEEGIRGVPVTVVEAATAAGSTPRQLLWKVQLPMARRGLLLAANQGIVMVLAMVVVGGLVGAGALGYDVVAGFSQTTDFGKGLAAGIAIVLLGVMLDRITQGAGGRATEERAAGQAR
ncbi:MAG: binding-protein-dependent transporter inner rane component [Streptosporangiaceae bacterium]|nr:binding-protein-dependent transporter inner rane component [Streptosporangiaceae bacterium]